MFDDNYIKEVNAAYWAEEDEMKAGVHSSQVKERIEETLYEQGVEFDEITFLDWTSFEGMRVGVEVDGKFYGIFNYDTNIFE